MDAKTHISHDQLQNRFAYHPADTQEKKDKHEAVRDTCLSAADDIVRITGSSTREQSLAITKFEEAMFWANAAIARNP